MSFDILIKPLASLAYIITKSKEKRLGYQLEFKNIPRNWLQAKVVYEMDSVWKNEGLHAIGTNYFTIGCIENGLSSRFNPDSAYYQSWLGGYLVKFSEKRKWEINDHFRLAEADQKNWLKLYGDQNPTVEIDFKTIEKLGIIEINGFVGQLYCGDIYSDTDIGSGKVNKIRLSGLAVYFNKTNKELNLKTENIIPIWKENNLLNAYEKIHLRGYIAILDISDSVKAVLYANAANYNDRNGKKHDNFSKIDDELLELIKNVEIQKL